MTAAPGIVVIGAGQAGVQAAESLRDAGWAGPVTLVGDESPLPYQRPPLSKEYLLGKASADSVTLRGEAFYADRGITLLTGCRAAKPAPERRVVALDDGRELPYEHLVLATGTRPRPLPVPGAELEGVLSLRTLADAQELQGRLRQARHVVIVGAGFIGLEVAAACRALGVQAVVIEAAGLVMGRAVTPDTSAFFADRHRRDGTPILLGCGVAELLGQDGRVVAVRTSDGVTLAADVVVMGVGVVPNAELAEAAGLATDNGIVVDTYLRTTDPHISAIGDCAAFPDARTGLRVRLESVQNAADQARCLAARLTGTPRPYGAVPWFWSYQGDLRLQIAGLSAGHDGSIVRRGRDSSAFSVFCFRGDTLVAVESVNSPADHMAARRLLSAGLSPRPEEVADPDFTLRSYVAQATAVRAN